jgi:hypothetical protein
MADEFVSVSEIHEFPPQVAADQSRSHASHGYCEAHRTNRGEQVMDDYQESNHNENENGRMAPGAERWLVVAVIALLAIAVIAFTYGYHQQSLVRQLTAESTTASASVTQLENQVSALTAKLNDMTAAQTAAQTTKAQQSSSPADSEPSTSASAQTPDASASPTSTPAASPKPAHTKKPAARRRTPVDTKYNQLQAQLADQQKQLKATQEEVEKNRADLEGSLSSTRDDLNGSIARTHEELVTLEKRGERSYYEFDLSKSKQFSRVGPVTLSLRKADTKHRSYNLAMIVDDDQLQKKNVNLFEPIWIHTENESQPVQIVVNKIDKDFVHGYVSAPKYKPSELNTSGSATGATVTPVSAKTPASTTPTPNPQQPPPSEQPQQPLPLQPEL